MNNLNICKFMWINFEDIISLPARKKKILWISIGFTCCISKLCIAKISMEHSRLLAWNVNKYTHIAHLLKDIWNARLLYHHPAYQAIITAISILVVPSTWILVSANYNPMAEAFISELIITCYATGLTEYLYLDYREVPFISFYS